MMVEEYEHTLDVIKDRSHYKLIRKLAEGGMGAVYEAQQLGAEGFVKTMAIKTILPHYTNNKEFVDMFIGEAKLVANLVHENIVQIYQMGRDEADNYYIAMEYMDGINLEEFLYHHKELEKYVPVELAAFIAARVCRGLEYAHNKTDETGEKLNIVHRDVSPKNIMINKEGTVRLTDFGVAKAKHYMQQQEGEVLMGKVEFMSPEQADYQVTDGRSDLFSLGIVLYELITGVNIFDDDDVYETLERIKTLPITDPREFRKEIPEDLAEIIMKAMNRDLDKRYQSAGEMGYALEYHLYNKGYGPTVQTLSKYLNEIYPEKNFMTSSIDTTEFTERMTRDIQDEETRPI
ncbi:MAG: serine/threonine protein kinase [Planctomycetota bacterium]|jgi:serine/threonine-protein kinase